MTIQVQVLNKILQTKDFSIVTLNNLDASYFYEYKAEFEFIRSHIDLYGVVPDKLTFADNFPDFEFVDVQEPDSYLLLELDKARRVAIIANGFNAFKDAVEAGNIDAALDVASGTLTKYTERTVGMTCTDIISDGSRYEHYKERALGTGRQYYKTGFVELDKDLGGIDPDNENMVIAARTGIGKSWVLVKFAAALSSQGLAVGIYSGEMATDKIAYRIDTLLGGIDNRALNRGDPVILEQYRKYIESVKSGERKLGPIKVITPADINGPADTDALKAFIEREHIDVLLIDQYSLLEAAGGNKGRKAQWETVGDISKAIKNLQVMYQIPIISVAQMNRTKTDDGEQDTTQIGLSDRIPQDATVLIMLSRDKENESLTLNVVKARDGGEGKKYTYRVDLNTGTFTYIDEKPTAKAAKNLHDSYSIAPEDEQQASVDEHDETIARFEEAKRSFMEGLPWAN